jgi:hypothetical protein
MISQQKCVEPQLKAKSGSPERPESLVLPDKCLAQVKVPTDELSLDEERQLAKCPKKVGEETPSIDPEPPKGKPTEQHETR